MALNDAEQLALEKVLDFRLALTRKNTPQLQPLSLYSSELKGTKQIAGCLREVRDSGALSTNATTRNRYFNSLSNQGLVEGTAAAPILSPLAQNYLRPLNDDVDDAFWQGSGGDNVEHEVISALAVQLAEGHAVSDAFRVAWLGAQTFFDYVPQSELDGVLGDRSKLLFLFRLNSNGWEIGRYFRLDQEERAAFESAFEKVRLSSEVTPTSPIEAAAAQYKDAASMVQADVRFRISGFLNSYGRLRASMGGTFPRLDRQLVLRTSSGDGASHGGSTGTVSSSAVPLPHPHQLIVTGCPGSGKSYYVDELTQGAQHIIRTQFHPETSYFDFVGAYKPHPIYEPHDDTHPLEEGDGTVSARGKPYIDYRYVPGPLIHALTLALKHPEENVVVLIEEINRGNAAAILGDILQLLDRTQMGVSRYEIAATLEQRAYFASQGIVLQTVRLPSNLYIWSTMNSADQGVFPLDTAFRRRWNYVYMGFTEPCAYPETQKAVIYGGRRYSWDAFRAAINEVLIGQGIHEDKLIGPYFLKAQELASPDAVLEKLFLYLWDDVLRFRQEALFIPKSFSSVMVTWANGNGQPLRLTLPTPLASAEPENPGSSAEPQPAAILEGNST